MVHLGSIRKKYAQYFEDKLRGQKFEPNIVAAKRNFSRLTGKSAPERYLDLHSRAKSDGVLFYTLVQESLAPITIIHGYEGYGTEAGLRGAFIDILEDSFNKGKGGFGGLIFQLLLHRTIFAWSKGMVFHILPPITLIRGSQFFQRVIIRLE